MTLRLREKGGEGKGERRGRREGREEKRGRERRSEKGRGEERGERKGDRERNERLPHKHIGLRITKLSSNKMPSAYNRSPGAIIRGQPTSCPGSGG